jgi:hypothetical protein
MVAVPLLLLAKATFPTMSFAFFFLMEGRGVTVMAELSIA